MTVSRNSIFVIEPYKSHYGSWVFDDERVGLVREPFVAGADIMMDQATQTIPGAANGFILRFSTAQFPGVNMTLTWLREEAGGNWYKAQELGLEGWLCPALFRYFEQAPPTIFVQTCAPKPR